MWNDGDTCSGTSAFCFFFLFPEPVLGDTVRARFLSGVFFVTADFFLELDRAASAVELTFV
jgi:hypothetical protein